MLNKYTAASDAAAIKFACLCLIIAIGGSEGFTFCRICCVLEEARTLAAQARSAFERCWSIDAPKMQPKTGGRWRWTVVARRSGDLKVRPEAI